MGRSPNPKLRICLLFVVLAFILATTLFSPAGDEFLRSHKSSVPRKVFDDSKDQKRFESLATKLVNVRAVSSNGSTNASSCGFAGNSDIYGLGIRLGVYLQWIATFVSYQLLEDSIDSVVTANWVFLFATMIATLVITASRSSYNTYSAEVIIMLYIIVGEIVVCVLPIIAEGNSLPSLLGVYGAFSAFFAVFLFASWFWFKGVWLMSPTPCGTYFSLLSKGAVTKSSQIAIPRAITTIFAVFWGVICVLGTWSILERIHEVYVKGKESRRSQHHSTLKALSGIVMRTLFELSRPIETRKKRHFFLDKGKKWKSNFRFVSVFTASLVDLWCLVAIETTLKWNKITGIYNLQSTGQFIPLIIGIGGVLSVMLSLLGIYLEKSEYNPENGPNATRETEEGTELHTLPSKQAPQQVQTTKLRNKLEGKEPEQKPIQAKGSAQEVSTSLAI